METSTDQHSNKIKKAFIYLAHQLSFISPYIFGILIFSFLYIRMCTNDSNLDGDKLFERGDFNAALDCYNQYLMLHPHHIKTLYNRGRCYDALGFAYKASKDYEEVLDRDSDNVKALISLSKYYYGLENFESAVNLSSYATNIDDENYLAYYHKARACHKLGLISDALDAYNKTIDLNPEFGFSYFQRSSILISLGLHPFGCHDLQVAACLNVEGAAEALEKFCK